MKGHNAISQFIATHHLPKQESNQHNRQETQIVSILIISVFSVSNPAYILEPSTTAYVKPTAELCISVPVLPAFSYHSFLPQILFQMDKKVNSYSRLIRAISHLWY